jgi:hypothetical protein
MSHVHALCLLLLPAGVMAQSPVRQAFAYSRTTVAGIPGHAALPTSYYIYVVVKRGAAVTLRAVCLRGSRYAATLRRVDAPVSVDHDVGVPTGKRDTLVAKTSDDVYQVDLTEPTGSCGKVQADLARHHEVVVCLTSGAAMWYGLVAKIVPLSPAAAM